MVAELAETTKQTAGNAFRTVANQVNPLPGGNLARTSLLVGSLALTGLVAASTGIAVPITEINSTATAMAAENVSGWAVAGGAGTDVMSHAWNCGATILGGLKDVATGADWSMVQEGLTAG